MVEFLDLTAQYREIRDKIDAAIRGVLEDSAFIGGARVETFEREFAAYQQAEHCVGVANGTDALEIVLEALRLPAGSEVIVPANSFMATSEAVTRAGHWPVFCDCLPGTYLMDPADLARRITDRTAAVMPVHLYGQPADMDAILEVARRHGLRVIEDAAQAHGAEYRGRRVGVIGDAGTFSFYPGKNLGAYGDAGAIVTNDRELALRCRMIANHGRTEKYVHEMEGRNSRLDGLQAAVLSVKLNHLDGWIDRRRAVAAAYGELLADGPVELPVEAEGARHVYHLYVVRSSEREALREHLAAHGIGTGIHYPLALPLQPAYRDHPQAGESFLANALGDELLSLPIGDHMSRADAERVAAAVHSFRASSTPV